MNSSNLNVIEKVILDLDFCKRKLFGIKGFDDEVSLIEQLFITLSTFASFSEEELVEMQESVTDIIDVSVNYCNFLKNKYIN